MLATVSVLTLLPLLVVGLAVQTRYTEEDPFDPEEIVWVIGEVPVEVDPFFR